MTADPVRRRFLQTGAATLALGASGAARAASEPIAAIEARHGGRLGVFACDTGNGQILAHRADERFLLQSTFKLPLAALTLVRVDERRDSLTTSVAFGRNALRPSSPVTGAHVAEGRLSVAMLCQAILERSDNAAANLLMARAGGPPAVTSFLRSLGDQITRVDRYELVDGWSGEQDTSTPRAMARSAQAIVLGSTLSPASLALLRQWMAHCAAGQTRLRASLPADWHVCDRTGTGDGVCNDVAVAWPSGRPPLIMAVYYEAAGMTLPDQEAVLRKAGDAILRWSVRPA